MAFNAIIIKLKYSKMAITINLKNCSFVTVPFFQLSLECSNNATCIEKIIDDVNIEAKMVKSLAKQLLLKTA